MGGVCFASSGSSGKRRHRGGHDHRDQLIGRTVAHAVGEDRPSPACRYPTSGLGTATSLAKRAGVSDPTVVRLVMKLGFEASRIFRPSFSPKSRRAALAADDGIGGRAHPAKRYRRYLDSVGKRWTIGSTTPLQSYDRAAADHEARGDVVLLDRRFSRHVAGMLAGYLVQFRPGIRDLGVLSRRLSIRLPISVARMC